jgi:hypothetical protein
MAGTPLLKYLHQVLREHTRPLPDMRAGIVEATWLVLMIKKVEETYRENGTI